MEHIGETGVWFSVGVEMEVYGDQGAAPSDQFCYKSWGKSREEGRSQAGNFTIANIEWYIGKLGRSPDYLLTTFQVLIKYTEHDQVYRA